MEYTMKKLLKSMSFALSHESTRHDLFSHDYSSSDSEESQEDTAGVEFSSPIVGGPSKLAEVKYGSSSSGFRKLSTVVDEGTRVRYIRKNLLPQYVTQLALTDVSSVEHLSSLCRKLETSTSNFDQPRLCVVEKNISNLDLPTVPRHIQEQGASFLVRENGKFCFRCGRKGKEGRTDGRRLSTGCCRKACGRWPSGGREAWPYPHRNPSTQASVTIAMAALRLQIASTLRRHGLQPSDLRIEVTETTVLDPNPMTLATARALHDHGVLLSMDDFGTGYSSLAALHSLPISMLKLDKSFIKDLAADAPARALTAAVLHIGESLGLEVVAEGVETEEQHSLLVALGCPLVQGYLFARPMPATALQAWLGCTAAVLFVLFDRTHSRRIPACLTILGRAAHGAQAHGGQACLQLRGSHDLADLGGQALHDGPGRARSDKGGEPAIGLEA
ncbi:hypothetical protein FQR65_LT18046 [Abscondita terminalis]|nr:hypothetical protein FQR65_LT18046 [Abscondita terminalis]